MRCLRFTDLPQGITGGVTVSDEIDLKAFADQAIGCLEKAEGVYPWLDKRGDIIQCPPGALREGDFYVMGFNPGGDAGESIRNTTAKIPSSTAQDHPLKSVAGNSRPRLCMLAEVLGLGDNRVGKLFVTNLFPDCSAGIPGWKKRHGRPVSDYVEAIWPLHELMLSIVRPRFIIVSGINRRDSAFSLLWDRFHPADMCWDDTMSKVTKADDPRIKSFSTSGRALAKENQRDRVTFIGIPHLSRRAPIAEVIS
jgi:hypothetical protein